MRKAIGLQIQYGLLCLHLFSASLLISSTRPNAGNLPKASASDSGYATKSIATRSVASWGGTEKHRDQVSSYEQSAQLNLDRQNDKFFQYDHCNDSTVLQYNTPVGQPSSLDKPPYKCTKCLTILDSKAKFK
jgi:hypothetical protein